MSDISKMADALIVIAVCSLIALLKSFGVFR